MTVSRATCMWGCPDYDGPERNDALRLMVMGRTTPGQEIIEQKRCLTCWRGLGDMVAWIIGKVTFNRVQIKTGCGCSQKIRWLNRTIPFRQKEL